jgi:hypothetical protein
MFESAESHATNKIVLLRVETTQNRRNPRDQTAIGQCLDRFGANGPIRVRDEGYERFDTGHIRMKADASDCFADEFRLWPL